MTTGRLVKSLQEIVLNDLWPRFFNLQYMQSLDSRTFSRICRLIRDNGNDLVLFALANYQLELVEWLLEKKVEFALFNEQGKTAFHVLAEQYDPLNKACLGSQKIARIRLLLLAAGVDINAFIQINDETSLQLLSPRLQKALELFYQHQTQSKLDAKIDFTEHHYCLNAASIMALHYVYENRLGDPNYADYYLDEMKNLIKLGCRVVFDNDALSIIGCADLALEKGLTDKYSRAIDTYRPDGHVFNTAALVRHEQALQALQAQNAVLSAQLKQYEQVLEEHGLLAKPVQPQRGNLLAWLTPPTCAAEEIDALSEARRKLRKTNHHESMAVGDETPTIGASKQPAEEIKGKRPR